MQNNVQNNHELVRQVLESKINELAANRALRDSIRIHQVADPIDMTQLAAEREMAVQNLDRKSAVVRQLRSAIARIEDGSYGVCLECEEPISPKRLKAVAWAELCIRCQEEADRGQSSERDFSRDRAWAA